MCLERFPFAARVHLFMSLFESGLKSDVVSVCVRSMYENVVMYCEDIGDALKYLPHFVMEDSRTVFGPEEESFHPVESQVCLEYNL